MKNTSPTLDLLLEKIGSNCNAWIYGCGLAGQWFFLEAKKQGLDGYIKGFVDTDLKKSGRKYFDKEVIGLSDFKKRREINDLVVISVIDIQDVVDLFKSNENITWHALGEYLNSSYGNDFDLNQNADYVKYALGAVEECHKGYLDPSKVFLRSVDVVITERCSLKCKDCSNLMQYYKRPQNLPSEEILNDFNDLAKKVDHIYEIRLIGGEPFMNKGIYEIIENLLSSKKITRLVLYTNGMIPIKEDKLPLLKDERIVFSITDYGDLAKNTKGVIETLKKNKVSYKTSPPVNWTDSGTILPYQDNKDYNQHLFDMCCGKNLLTLSRGKLYRCPFAANAERLNAIPIETPSGVSLDSSTKQITDYIKQCDAISACAYCKGRSFDAPEIEPAIQTKKPLSYALNTN